MAISNYDDVIDSRDVIERIENLSQLRQPGPVDLGDDDDNDADQDDLFEELAALEKLAEQCGGYADDWEHGVTLIRDSYFETYAQELAEDIGAINSEATWPHNCIDWEQAARELRMDYTAVEFDGVTYWVRW